MIKVVLIEDDVLLAAHYERVLEKVGYDVSSISHAIGALDLIDKVKPDVIVLDMLLIGSTVMPLLNEMSTHEDLAALPVILVTSVAEELSLEELAPYGVREVLDKATFHPDDLISAIKKVSE